MDHAPLRALFLLLSALMGWGACVASTAPSGPGTSGIGLHYEQPDPGPIGPRGGIRRVRSGWPENLHASHTFFAPTAWPLEQGHGYYQNSYLLMHSAWFSPLKGVSIGGGFELTSLVASVRNKERNPGFFVGMRMGTEVGGGVYVGVVAIGASFSRGAFASEEAALPDRVGILAGQVTGGTEDVTGTLSFGWGATPDGLTEDPLFGFSGQARVMDRLAIVTENWLLRFGKEPLNIYSLGARFLHRRLAFDGGLIHNKQFVGKLSPLMPYVGFAWWL